MTLVVSTQGHHHFHKLRVLQPNLVRAGHLPAAFHCELIGFLLVGGHLLKGKLRISTPCSEVRSSSLLHRSLLRSEEHTSELQSRQYLVCRLLLEKKKRLRFVTP